MAEIKKYNPANITPEHLFRPPTSQTYGELKYLIGQVDHALVDGFLRSKRLLVGTELEILFFSPDMDPHVSDRMKPNQNPNYSVTHKLKLKEIGRFAEEMRQKRPSEFLMPEKIGRAMFEFRTAPQQVQDHLQTLEVFGDLLRSKSTELNVLPVVYSQHIHVSLRNNPFSPLASINKKGITPTYESADKAFSKITPMVLLPEEWDSRVLGPISLKSDGIISGSSAQDLEHTEFRMLSSEYANDPTLNLLLTLRALHMACIQKKDIVENKYSNDYELSVSEMEKDSELVRFFGQSTLSTIARILGQYPSVSERKITIDQVR